MEIISGTELVQLIQRVFSPVHPRDSSVVFLLDLPDEIVPDTQAWSARRAMVRQWALDLGERQSDLGLSVSLFHYRNSHHNNADLPPTAVEWDGVTTPESVDELVGEALPFSQIFQAHTIFIAPTQFSATAPLKLAAREYSLRAATMPGFSPEMIPALRLDYQEINRRVMRLKLLLDQAERATLCFRVDDEECYKLTLDLRFRQGHASGGVLPENGVAGNLPSGEAYMVPYEGERDGEPSGSQGELPVQFGEEVVVYAIENNRARVVSNGPVAELEAHKIEQEPAYSNLAELGLGVLADFGVKPCGEILLDEKLGLHIAFGRSDHFGGQVGADNFSSPENVVHIDRVFIPETMPRIVVEELDLHLPGGEVFPLIRSNAYVLTW